MNPVLPIITALGALAGAGLVMAAGVSRTPPASTPARCSAAAIGALMAGSADTRVIAARAFAEGDRLPMSGDTPVTAGADLCMVKLLVGPGTTGPTGAPSTQAGIGLEIWLPSPTTWNGRIHNVGGGGFVGQPDVSDPERAVPSIGEGIAPSIIAGSEGAVSGYTDTGHKLPAAGADGSFLMRPDGSVSEGQWRDFAERGIHQLAVQTKALAAAYYGRAAAHSYFEGCSTGGRQAHKEAQAFPEDYDGIIGGAPAMNWTRFTTSELYPQLVMQRELGGPIAPAKLQAASSAAVSACDLNGGRHMGYLTDPAACRYDPAKDKALLCRADGGGSTSGSCLSLAEARTINRIWYGQTANGIAPDPATNNGATGTMLAPGRQWFGILRGTQQALAGSKDGRATPFPIATHMVALINGHGPLADPTFRNAAGDGADGWKAMTYTQLATTAARGDALQTRFSRINAADDDLSAFRRRGGKFLAYHGLADQVIAPQGTMRYHDALIRREGAGLRDFYRFVTVPGMGHCQDVGSADGIAGISPKAAPPLPENGQFYAALVDWVEHGRAPDRIVVRNTVGEAHLLCEYPATLRYLGGKPVDVSSYRCIVPRKGKP